MSDIKHVIINLCKYINLVLEEDFKPEYFRQAKFNQTEDNLVSIYWTVLYKLIPKRMLFKSAFSIIDRVKLYFAALEYDSFDFFSLPDDESNGSRELLLALGYLLGEYDALDVLSHSLIENSRVNLEFPSPITTGSNVCDNITQFDTEDELIDNAAWLTGKINNNMKSVSENDTQIIRLLDKVHKISKNVSGLPHLSANDIYCIKYKEMTDSYMEECKRIASILEVKSKWNKTNSIFWDWMLSVLNEKEKDKSAQSTNGGESLSSFYDVLDCEVNAMSTKSVSGHADRNEFVEPYRDRTCVSSDARFKESVHSATPIRRCTLASAERSFRTTKDVNATSCYSNVDRRHSKRAEIIASTVRRRTGVRNETVDVDEIVYEEKQKIDRIINYIEGQMIDVLEQNGCRVPIE